MVDAFGIALPAVRIVGGPRLTFTAGPGPTGTEAYTDVDRRAPSDPRERALCRALLTHALRLLDEAEADRA